MFFPRPSSNTTQKEPGVNYLKKLDFSSEYSQELNVILKTAKSISSKPVLVTLINDGFMQLVCNWLCNTKHMGIHRQFLLENNIETFLFECDSLWIKKNPIPMIYPGSNSVNGEKAVTKMENDQVYLNRLVLNKYGGMKATMTPFSEFPDGKLIKASKSRRIAWHPYVIHNNWIIGRRKKMKRAKQWGHWFMKDNGECDDEQIRKIINL
ncbi:uncharacterized protein LOC134692580 [Mytilus trossulus]|uniref:uncharacterized protein LOC134692580 n=1 Tax=Mytilus trossulus TaxID=6551 RepID=UPI003005527B